MSVNPAVSLKIKNETTRKDCRMIWYFVLHKTVDEEYFRVRFVDTSTIEAGKDQNAGRRDGNNTGAQSANKSSDCG
jgi:hypothetical protein